MQDPRVIGITGWSGSGKTSLIIRLMPLLVQRGLRVATLKHAHHDFDVDIPGKDSYEHRKAGASEVIICSERRWVQMHELGAAREPTLAQLLPRVTTCDLILVEGYKRERHPKIEVFRPSIGKPALYLEDPHIVAIATDTSLQHVHRPVVDLNDTQAVAAQLLQCALALPEVLRILESGQQGR
jgi:molybdopterin-guanine dinucleotide biosynthesis protein B